MSESSLKIEVLLEQVIRFDASDLHIQVGLPPMLRVDGSLRPIEDVGPLDETSVEKLIFAVLDDDQKEILLKDKEVDFSFAFGDYGRFRVRPIPCMSLWRHSSSRSRPKAPSASGVNPLHGVGRR